MTAAPAMSVGLAVGCGDDADLLSFAMAAPVLAVSLQQRGTAQQPRLAPSHHDRSCWLRC